MRSLTDRLIVSRVFAGFFMGSLMVSLIGLAAAFGPTAGHPLAQSILPVAVIASVLVATFSSTARTAWGRLCLINGTASIALAAANVRGRGQPPWPTDPGFERALDQAFQWWLRYVVWTAFAYFGAAVVLATVLFALSY